MGGGLPTARLRRVVFWCHLSIGLGAGAVILLMSVTGSVLALQPQILTLLERNVREIPPPAGAEPLPASAILAAASAAKAPAVPVSLVLRSERSASAAVSLGAAGTVYIDPYTGRVVGDGANTARRAFTWLTETHRWFGLAGERRTSARAVTGAANLGFLALAVSGLFLWWPRKGTAAHLRAALAINRSARGRARHFNHHTVIGFWCAPILIVLTSTGAVLSYPWANSLLFRLAGSTPPRAAETRAVPAGVPSPPDFRQIDEPLGRATTMIPTWNSITVRVPARTNAPVSFTITDAVHWNQFARSQLTVAPGSNRVLSWEPYASLSAGQKLRGWFRFAHTGELGGIAGQVVAGAASLGGAWLVWTGFALAIRRFRTWRNLNPRAARRAA